MTTKTTKIYAPVLHQGQKRIFKGIIEDNALFHTVVTPRQFGKSFLAIQLLLYFAINNPNYILCFTSVTHKQSQKVFKELLTGIKHLGIIKEKNLQNNSIILNNGSEIMFHSIQIPDNLRGYSVDVLIVDEAAMYKEDIFYEVLRPFLRVRGKKCILLSTPKGKNYFYNMYLTGLDGDKVNYKSYKGLTIENPYANKEEYEDAKRALPENIFKQEYQGEFVDDAGSVFSNYRNCALIDTWIQPSDDIYFAGIDFGRKQDYTVLTIMNKQGEVCYIYRDNQKPWEEIVKNIVRILRKYNPRYSLLEINNIGDAVFEMIQKQFKKVDAFVTTNDSKQDIIEELILGFENGDIKIPTEKLFQPILTELDDFGFSYTKKTRKYSYSALHGHDDTVISLGLANHARLRGINKGNYNITII